MADIETPGADAAEQEQTVTENERTVPVEELPVEADEGDVAESRVEVPLDDEEYR
jgi:hypothetical protein